MKQRARALSPARQKRNERRFQEAVTAHQQGRLNDAASGYLRIVESDPDHAHALHHLGLIRHQHGHRHEALQLLERAARAAPDDASIQNNYGNMLRESGDLDRAVTAYRACVAADPTHANGRYNLAMTLLDGKRPEEAVQVFQWFVDNGVDDAAMWNARAQALVQCGRADEAVASAERSIAAAPAEPVLKANLVDALIKAHRYEDAMDEARAAERAHPDNLSVRRALAGGLLHMTRYADAVEPLTAVLASTPDDEVARVWLARALTETNRGLEAVGICDEGLARRPDSPDLVLARGSALMRSGRSEEAIAELERAHALAPEWIEPLNNLAMAFTDIGRTGEAEDLFRDILARDPHSPEAWFHLARSGSRDAVTDDDVTRLHQLLDSGELLPERAVTLHFALAQIYDRRQDYARAFEQYAAGNSARRRFGRYDSQRFVRWVEGFHQVFDERLVARLARAGVSSERPVFVVGMPRSGTTLVEQILASHPQVVGGGELTLMAELATSLTPPGADEDAYPRVAAELDAGMLVSLAERYLAGVAAIDADAPRFSDKMPSNFFHIGLIALMFPNARIVHCSRDAMDVCFSNFIQIFATGHLYSYSLSDIAVYHREYVRLMAHWKALFPGRIYDVSYESLIDDQESVTRRLIEHVGLDWNDACLRFHDTERAVHTASHWQVRQPIYTSSRQRWRNYASFLRQLASDIGYQEGES